MLLVFKSGVKDLGPNWYYYSGAEPYLNVRMTSILIDLDGNYVVELTNHLSPDPVLVENVTVTLSSIKVESEETQALDVPVTVRYSRVFTGTGLPIVEGENELELSFYYMDSVTLEMFRSRIQLEVMPA